MHKAIQELIKRRDLLYMIAWREIKIRYKQSVMGFFWAILLPAVVVGAGILVRYGMSALSGKPVSAEANRRRDGESIAMGVFCRGHAVCVDESHREFEFGDEDLYAARDISDSSNSVTAHRSWHRIAYRCDRVMGDRVW